MSKLHTALNNYAILLNKYEKDYIKGKINIRLVFISYSYVNAAGELKRHYNYIVTKNLSDEFLKNYGDIIL